MLHTVNKSPFEKNSLETCLRLISESSSVLLIEDGVYGALKNTSVSDTVINAQKTSKFYVLGPDLKARGLDKSSLISNIEIIDYKGFVDLTIKNKKIQNWL
jgi:tRNA 2-thiouridine synthesizing protein B